MKKVYSFILITVFSASVFGQGLSLSFLPASAVRCYTGQGVYNYTATVTWSAACATSYSWSIQSPTNIASPNATIIQGGVCGGGIPSGTYIATGCKAVISLTACGIYTVRCYALLNNNTPCNSTAYTIELVCPPTVSLNSGTICKGNAYTLTPSGANTYTIQGGSNIVSPTVTTTYSVVGSQTINGCINSNTANATVSVNPLPTITVNSGTICQGASFSISPNGANSYTIQGGASVVNPTITSTYTVRGTSIFGCVSQNIVTSTVTVKANPNVAINWPNPICIGETKTLTATGANTYTWSNALNTNTIVVTPSITSIYSVTGTGTNNCINTASVKVTVNPCTSIKDQSLNQISIYPNPAKTQITLNTTTNQIGKTLKVYDALGKVVYETILKQQQYNINITNWANGIYTVAIPEQDLTYKFVKE